VRTAAARNGFVELVQGPPEGALVVLSGSAFIVEATRQPSSRRRPPRGASAPAPPGPSEAPRDEKPPHLSWAIHNPIPVVVLFVALTLAGLISYMMLPIKQFPDVSFPQVVVTITQAGARPASWRTRSPARSRTPSPGIQDIDVIQSTVVQGVSTTVIAFDIGTDEQRATDDVQSAIDLIQHDLPREIDEPNVARISWTDQPIITYAVIAPTMSDTELSWFIDNTIERDPAGREGRGAGHRVGGSTSRSTSPCGRTRWPPTASPRRR
jgi:hypothetical protein